VILSSDIAGEHRFASAVAQRLSQLGALTQGDRHASSAADALAPFNLQNTCARTPARARAAVAQAPARRAGEPSHSRPAWLPGRGRAASHLQHLCVSPSAGVPCQRGYSPVHASGPAASADQACNVHARRVQAASAERSTSRARRAPQPSEG